MGFKVDPQQFLDDGYLVLRGVIPPGQLGELRASFDVLVERQKALWARERRPGDPPGGVWETHKQPRLKYDTVVDESTANTVEFCMGEDTLGVSRQLIRGSDVGFHELLLLCNPVRDHGPDKWHRDTSPAADAPLQGLATDLMANGPGYVQWNVPLYDDDVLWVIPGSHRRDNTEEEERQWVEDNRAPLPGAIPVELKAGDAVVYTNFILHWPSNYSSKLRRTIIFAHQSFLGPLYRYFHLWWDIGFTKNLPAHLRAPFEHWDRCIAREHNMIESMYRAMLDRDAAAFQAALIALHSGEVGRMVCVTILSKVAQKLYQMTRPGYVQSNGADASLHLYQDMIRRFSRNEIDSIWQRFGTLDAKLQTDAEQIFTGAQGSPTWYRGYEMPANFEVEDFIASWNAKS